MSVRSARKHDGALSECVRRGQRVSTTCWMGNIPIRIMNIYKEKSKLLLAKTSTWRDLDRFKVCSLLNNQCLSITRECGVFIRPQLERHRRKLNSA